MSTPRILLRATFALGVALAPVAAQQPDGPKADAPRHVRDAARLRGEAEGRMKARAAVLRQGASGR